MLIITLELTRVNPDRNIFSIQCGTNIYFFFSTDRFGPSSSTNFNSIMKVFKLSDQIRHGCIAHILTHIFPIYSFLRINMNFTNYGMVS